MNSTQKYTAELLGTLVIVFVGSAAIVTTGNPLIAALALGLTWTGMWWVFGNVSGGHFNPAITIASVVAKKTDAKDAVPYIVVQILGGILGSALLWFVLKGAPNSFVSATAATLANPTMAGFSSTSILILEVLCTAFLALIWFAATEKTNAAGITGLAIGLGSSAVYLASIGLTWSGLNPVRTLGPALLAGTGFGTLWVFWVAPIVGAIVGAAIWMTVVQPTRTSAPSSYTAEA